MHFNQNQAREIIMDHYMNPTNKRQLTQEFETYFSNTCSDKLELSLTWEDGKVTKAQFNGHGCAVFVAATDIFLGLIVGKTKEQIKELVKLFTKFVNQEDLTQDELESLGDLRAFYNVKTHLNRVACALLTPNTFLND
ncbi:Fe-S cluster assembly sulfur transfer protein SufU [Mycoplasma seminis]|uniref:SUF system NifU family Fe-S cluster assembly protein n=1 Tax=Mycoplasma seminis TaxID=512749 RepID=A0ABY9HC36_9MOLU|nr:SUF system NifU family Fe-S cluster assembly protein [Mycoplasma seminis]WLP85933.1 SUF system NifU family Fe-S cluster assembly protein [Mycoplasma seminis]